MGEQPAKQNGSGRAPRARPGLASADSKKGGDQGCPKRSVGVHARVASAFSPALLFGALDSSAGLLDTESNCSFESIGLHVFLSKLSGLLSSISSPISVTGEEITYAPLAHLPRSIKRQRSLQKGKSELLLLTGFLQVGQCNLPARLRDIAPHTTFATRS
jgi:hypothetical protein